MTAKTTFVWADDQDDHIPESVRFDSDRPVPWE